MTTLSPIDLRVRAAVYDVFARGETPFTTDVAASLDLAEPDVRASYQRLAERHIFVLHPDSKEIWMAMPFSAVETPFRVVAPHRAWWANCAWDALGIAAALETDIRVQTSCGDGDAPMGIAVQAGRVEQSDARCHFAIPAARWWDDIGQT